MPGGGTVGFSRESNPGGLCGAGGGAGRAGPDSSAVSTKGSTLSLCVEEVGARKFSVGATLPQSITGISGRGLSCALAIGSVTRKNKTKGITDPVAKAL
ncbi:MAG: hypothetical protein Cons2KO_01760 [Congregibacter sp.]